MTVKFKFNIDHKVVTPTGIGIIQMCAVDQSEKILYFVVTPIESAWWRQDQLELV